MLPLGGGTLKNQKYMLSLAAAIVQPVSGRAAFPTPSPGGKDDPAVEATLMLGSHFSHGII